MEPSRPADRWIALLRGFAAIFLVCYGLTVIVHAAHRDDWLSVHTFAIAVPGALLVFGLAGIAPAVLFALLRFRLRFAWPLSGLWLACAAALAIAAATAQI